MSNTTATSKIMDRVAALLAVAEHPGTPGPEADTALRMANSLITKHAIDEAILRQTQTVSDRRAIRKMRIVLGTGEFTPYLRTIFEAAADALRVSIGTKFVRVDDKRATEFWMYGADEDVVWLDMLFNMIKLQFLLKLDPKWNDSLGYDANVYNFKVAGFKWAEINQIAVDHGHESRESTEKRNVARYTFLDEVPADAILIAGDETNPGRYDIFQIRKPNGFFHKLKAAYVRHAKVIGDDARVVTQSHQAYRLSFAESFRTTMLERLWNMKLQAEDEVDTVPGAAIAIRSVQQEANEALWAEFPDLNPEEIAKRHAALIEEMEIEARKREEMLAAMTTKERQKFLEEEEKDHRRNLKANTAWLKKNTRTLSRDRSATERGAKAANSVDLTRKAGSAGQGATRGQID